MSVRVALGEGPARPFGGLAMLARFRPRFNHATVVAYLALFVALGGGALAATSFIGTDGRIHGCVVSKTGQLTVVKPDRKCNKSQIAIAWNQRGPRGRTGPHTVQLREDCLYGTLGSNQDDVNPTWTILLVGS